MPFLVNIKNNTGYEGTVELFNAFNNLTNYTKQYYLTTTAGGSTTQILDFSTVVDANGNFNDVVKIQFRRDNPMTKFTQVNLPMGSPFTALQDSFNTNTNLNNSPADVDNGGAQIQVRSLAADYSQVAITITNPPSAPYDFYSVFCGVGDPIVTFDSSFLSLYNTTAPPVGAGISIEDNAYGDGGLNYTEFLREVSVSPILFKKITATFSNKSDAFGFFTMTNSSMNEGMTQNFRMQRSPYLNANTYLCPLVFYIDGFFGLRFQLSAYSDVNLKFWDERQFYNTESIVSGLEDNLLGL